jgi:hypothetical protein
MAKKAIDKLADTLGASAAAQDPIAVLTLIKHCVDARFIKQIAESEGVKTYIIKALWQQQSMRLKKVLQQEQEIQQN